MPPRRRQPPFPPKRIPTDYAYESLVDFFGHNEEDMKKPPSLPEMQRLSKQNLIHLTKLKTYFRGHDAYQLFVERFAGSVPDSAWEDVYDDARTYVRQYYRPVESNRKFLRMKSFVGSPNMSDVSDDESVLSIDPSNDESDDTNINFPKPVCAGIRRVCRYYDKGRRYRPYENDESERDYYTMNLRYN